MPLVFLERIPLPNLSSYVIISVLVLACSINYAIQGIHTPEWKGNWTQFIQEENHISEFLGLSYTLDYVLEILLFLIREPFCIWTVINMAYCCLLLFGKLIQKIVFGDLRVSEQQHIKDQFWNFVFYKFIFIFGVMNVKHMDKVLIWCSWFTLLGFLHLLSQLCKDRCDYVCFSPATPRLTHMKLISLIMCIFLGALGLLLFCFMFIWAYSLNVFTFMAAECLLVIVRTMYILTRYAIHIRDFTYDGVWENRGSCIYFSEFVFELTSLMIDFLHHLHMLVWCNIFLSVATLVNGLQLHHLLFQIKLKFTKHKHHLRVLRHMEENYPLASSEELEDNSDDCAICWDKLETARILPCGHLFHNACLQSWLEQDTSCPTCRTSLTLNQVSVNNSTVEERRQEGDAPVENQPVGRSNHFFHFDGSRYFSWLPSFSVEVTHRHLIRGSPQPTLEISQLNNMGDQVRQIFPNIPVAVILDDLRTSQSVEATIENILEGRVDVTAVSQATANLINHNPMLTNPTPAFPIDPTLESSFTSDDSVPSDSDTQIAQANENISSINVPVTDSIADEESSNSNSNEEEMIMTGSRFSKSAIEREKILCERKNHLLENARKRYISKLQSQEENYGAGTSSETMQEDDNVRNLAYEAAQRRITNNS